jgi:hypothetical protein
MEVILMRFFIEMEERKTHDPQELVAMLRHRVASCQYQLKLIEDEKIIYSFKSRDGLKSFLGIESSSFSEVDRIIKLDPLFAYSTITTTPVIPLRDLVEEIQDYIGEVIMDPEECDKLSSPPTTEKKPNEKYFLARKIVKPFSPLLSEEEQKDVARRTVLAQAYHWSEMEVYDENPLGQPVGILIAKAQSAQEVVDHVSECEVYPDTEMEMIELCELQETIIEAEIQLNKLRPKLDPQKYILSSH